MYSSGQLVKNLTPRGYYFLLLFKDREHPTQISTEKLDAILAFDFLPNYAKSLPLFKSKTLKPSQRYVLASHHIFKAHLFP